MKIAIFVEGQTEATFIRNMLSLVLGHDKISCDITTLSRGTRTPYSIVNPTAQHEYVILIAPGDSSVLSSMLERYPRLIAEGYDRVVGLRDMYGEAYRKVATKVDRAIIQKFCDGSNAQLASVTPPDKIHFHFAIMELEAWFLAMPGLFQGVDHSLTVSQIKDKGGIDLAVIKVEDIFHPAKTVGEIFDIVGKQYKKTESDAEAITAKLAKDAIEDLVVTNNSPSFTDFYRSIMPA